MGQVIHICYTGIVHKQHLNFIFILSVVYFLTYLSILHGVHVRKCRNAHKSHSSVMHGISILLVTIQFFQFLWPCILHINCVYVSNTFGYNSTQHMLHILYQCTPYIITSALTNANMPVISKSGYKWFWFWTCICTLCLNYNMSCTYTQWTNAQVRVALQ